MPAIDMGVTSATYDAATDSIVFRLIAVGQQLPRPSHAPPEAEVVVEPLFIVTPPIKLAARATVRQPFCEWMDPSDWQVRWRSTWDAGAGSWSAPVRV